MYPQPPTSTLFPYTTLFRSLRQVGRVVRPPGRTGEHVVGLGVVPRRQALLGLELALGPQHAHEPVRGAPGGGRSEEHTSELQSQFHLVCRLLLEKKKIIKLS